MKRIKKIFSKTITLVLLVSMLIPFTSIPKVEAETNKCESGTTPEYHTNYYFFLQAETPFTWAEMFANEATDSRTAYFTEFLYNFPTNGTKIHFEEGSFVKITDSKNISENYALNTDEWTAAEFYNALNNENMAATFKGNLKDYAFESKGTGTKENRIVHYLYHGDWAHLGTANNTNLTGVVDANGNIIINLNDIKVNSSSLDTSKTNINNLVDASILINKTEAAISNVDIVNIGLGTLTNSKLTLDRNVLVDAIQSYNSTGKGYGVVTKEDAIDEPIINLAIQRRYSLTDDIFNTANGKNYKVKVADSSQSTTDGNSKNYDGLITLSDGTTLYYGVDNGKLYYLADTNNDNIGDKVLTDLRAIPLTKTTGETYYWFLAPTLYQMSYYVCKADHDEGTVVVTYDGNDKNAKNVPAASDPIPVGNDYTVSTQKPTLEGNTFKIWSTDKSCGNSGKKIEPGAKLEELSSDVTLYACWGSTETTKNSGTGVLTYAGLFTGIIALAGGTYYIVKKKNLFKKI